MCNGFIVQLTNYDSKNKQLEIKEIGGEPHFCTNSCIVFHRDFFLCFMFQL
jgi:hypothetical protein